MPQEHPSDKPLVEQILDEMFTTLESLSEFDDETIQRLKQLAQSGGLKKPALVTKAIKVLPGEHHEDTGT